MIIYPDGRSKNVYATNVDGGTAAANRFLRITPKTEAPNEFNKRGVRRGAEIGQVFPRMRSER